MSSCILCKSTDSKQISINNASILDKIDKNDFTWSNLISGFSTKKPEFNVNNCGVYLKVNDLYDVAQIIEKLQRYTSGY